MGFQLETSVPIITVFLQGILSFFSPCVLPLLPLYVSYLAGGTGTVGEDGKINYPRGKVLVNTIFFVLGISFTCFLLGFAFTTLGQFFNQNSLMFARISGIIMVAFGLYQFGVFGRNEVIDAERRLPFRLDKLAMSPLVALVLGFTFSFAWTPCIGPVLSSVLLMASSAQSASLGYLLIGVYTLGFVLPFLAVGLFTSSVLSFFKTHHNVVKYTVKIGAVLLILMGIMTITGYMNGITGYLSSLDGLFSQSTAETTATPTPAQTAEANPVESVAPTPEATAEATPEPTPEPTAEQGESTRQEIPAIDFTLVDQYGNTHSLADYEGKTIFLNFWATWCPPCQAEMPDIEALYHAYGENTEDLIVLGVANPKSDEYAYSQEDLTIEEVADFLEENGYTFPVLMDVSADLFNQYGISAFPTTFMIGSDGNIFGYVAGSLSAEMMDSIVQQTMDGVMSPLE